MPAPAPTPRGFEEQATSIAVVERRCLTCRSRWISGVCPCALFRRPERGADGAFEHAHTPARIVAAVTIAGVWSDSSGCRSERPPPRRASVLRHRNAQEMEAADPRLRRSAEVEGNSDATDRPAQKTVETLGNCQIGPRGQPRRTANYSAVW